MIAPPALADACEMVQSQATSNPSAIAQQAALAALQGERTAMEAMVAEFAARRKLMVEGLASIPGIRCRMPEGAFYAFPDAMAVASFFLEHARSAVVPGSAFGAPGFVRLSYATSQALIREGLSRIAAAVASLR